MREHDLISVFLPASGGIIAERYRTQFEQIRLSISALAPIGRIATAEEVAATALFPASDAASYMVGVLLSVDRGVAAQ